MRVLAAVVTVSLPAPSVAQDGPSVVALGVTRTPEAGAAGCTDEATLRADVARELGRDPFRDDAPLSVRIELGAFRGEGSPPRHSAVLTVRSPDGAELGHRVLESDADTCDELSAAIVLSLVLLASDPTGGLGGLLAPPEPAGDPPPVASEAPAEALTAPDVDPPAEPGPDDRTERQASDAEPPQRATTATVDDLAGAPSALAAGALLRIDSELLPSTVAALGLTGVLRARGVPAITAELTVSFPAQADLPGLSGVTADLRAIAGSLGLCPLESARGAALVVAACIGIRLGALTSEGRGFDTAHDETGLLVSLPIGIRGDLAVAGPVLVSAFAEIAPALVRTSFVAQHDTAEVTVHRVPSLGLAAGLAASVRFSFEDSSRAPTTP